MAGGEHNGTEYSTTKQRRNITELRCSHPRARILILTRVQALGKQTAERLRVVQNFSQLMVFLLIEELTIWSQKCPLYLLRKSFSPFFGRFQFEFLEFHYLGAAVRWTTVVTKRAANVPMHGSHVTGMPGPLGYKVFHLFWIPRFSSSW